MRAKSEIYSPKRDEEHPCPSHMGVPPPHPAGNSPAAGENEARTPPSKGKEDPTLDPGDGGNRAYILLGLYQSIIIQFDNKVPLQSLQLMGQTYIQCCFSYVRK